MIKIKKGDLTLDHKKWVYPAGEIGVRLDTDNHKFRHSLDPHTTIWARLQSSNDIMELMMVTDALRRWNSETPIHLVMPMTPYGRQDRVCVSGESLSIKAFANIINSLGFEKVTTFDPHSEVTPAVFDRMKVIDQATVISRFDRFNARLVPSIGARPIFVSPDAGANKKTAALAGLYGHSSFIRADKMRDLATGKIKEIVVVSPREDVVARDCVVLDDIGDKCGTFVGLAAALKAKGAKSIELFITHGIFSAEIDSILNPLCEAGVFHIWTTNSYRTDKFAKPELVTVLNLESVFPL